MAREFLACIVVLVYAAMFAQQAPLCSYRRIGGNDNVIINGTIREEGRFFITWNKACGFESLRFPSSSSSSSSFVGLSFVETFPSRSCSDIYVLDSLAQGYIGVVHTCPARMLGEYFKGKGIQLWFVGMGNDSVEVEVSVRGFVFPTYFTMSREIYTDKKQRLKSFGVTAANTPTFLSLFGDGPYFPGTTTWIIFTTNYLPAQNVLVRVLQADGTDCTAMEVRVYDGSSMSEKSLLGSFCDTRPFFLSSAGSLTVVFHTNLTRPSGRFLLSYAQVPQTFASLPCNTTVDVKRQPLNMMSPGFPILYPDRLDCWWLFKAPKGANIVVQSQSFLLQPPSGSAPCTDWLAIYNTEDNSSALLDKVCGSRNISGIFTQDSLLVWFHSEDNFTAPGFKLTVTARDPDGMAHCYQNNSREVLLQNKSYWFRLQSPNCSFILLKASGQFVRIWSNATEITSRHWCQNLFVYDGPNNSSPQEPWCRGYLNFRSAGKFVYVEYLPLYVSPSLFASSADASPLSTDSGSSLDVPAIMAGVAVPIVFLLVCIMCCVHFWRIRNGKRAQRRMRASTCLNMAAPEPEQNSRRRRASLSERIATVSERVAQRFVAPPSSYEAAVSSPYGAPPPPYSTVAKNRVSEELPPLDQDDAPPAYSDTAMIVGV